MTQFVQPLKQVARNLTVYLDKDYLVDPYGKATSNQFRQACLSIFEYDKQSNTSAPFKGVLSVEVAEEIVKRFDEDATFGSWAKNLHGQKVKIYAYEQDFVVENDHGENIIVLKKLRVSKYQ